MLYARAAIEAGVAYGNFTPSVAADAPALAEFARRRGVPVAGKDGKTGQTLLKTVLAPMLRARRCMWMAGSPPTSSATAMGRRSTTRTA
jgi:myo-inositol-1-phosphate synthase